MKSCSALLGMAVLVSALSAPAAESTVYTVTQLRDAMYAASPGDRIYVAPGNYNSRVWVEYVHGSPGNMIEVVALDPANRPVFSSDSASCLTFWDTSYILVDGIIAQHGGTASQGSNNIEFPYSSHVILKNSVSRWIDHDGNSDATKFAHADNVLVYNNHIDTWAAGGSAFDMMYTTDSLIMRNKITYPTLPTGAGANGPQPKGPASRDGFYKNTFIDGSSRCVQFGGSSAETGWEAFDMIAMGNVIVAGEAPVAYVSSRDSTFRYNTIVNPEKWVMRILNEGGWAQTGYNDFSRNIVQYGNISSIQNVGANTQPATFTYAENYWYRSTYPPGSIPSLPGGETDPAGGVNPQLDADYRPLHEPAKAYGAHAPAMEAEWATYTDWFAWAWAKALEFEPDARAGGQYRVAPGLTVTFDGGGSYAGEGSYGPHTITDYEWDLDRDGADDDGSGRTVTKSFAELTALGLGAGTHTIELKITSATAYDPITDWGLGELVILPVRLDGDCNLDGAVDVFDLAIFANNYRRPAGCDWRDGDLDFDGDVDVFDLALLANGWAQTIGGEPVPEPTAVLLIALALPALRRRRRR